MVSTELINAVLQQAIRVATHSWEYGTVAEALLEWNDPQLSIWNNPFPHGKVPTLNVANVSALTYIKPHIRTDNITLVDGDGAAGDPAAEGIPALLIGKTDTAYWDAALRQEEHLVNDVPRWSNGAISHRENVAELWADFVYMVPPFLAYTGVATSNLTLLKEAAIQAKLYRDVLIQPSGVWMHITGPEVQDYELWSTGNGWAAAGMARVLATLKKSPYANKTKTEQASLTGLIKEILDGVIKLDTDESGLLRNYLNQTSWFGEISGTSVLAATALRVAVLEPETFGKDYADWAIKKMDVVDGHINAEEGDNKGIVTPAVNPLDWHDETPYTTGSPEGQSFVVLLHAAYRDWQKKHGGKRGD
ncbi:uncharacterized protein N0V89_011463 [Didymosphaeria variabile]|uniref:Six-hairpin glycosidase n=1 Tax=Didymosphaeria variabile TaxID=1932322 RepID=A0A9W9C6F3_9PLEO|nr:uncharacterized protein N0V89_011463 [Didymosphaeria variabile]KAJ4345333.1 hypothetical protein N0V89_011463 [Didymosphaeria variabile]